MYQWTCAALCLPVCTPLGFARMFTVIGELVVKPKVSCLVSCREDRRLVSAIAETCRFKWWLQIKGLSAVLCRAVCLVRGILSCSYELLLLYIVDVCFQKPVANLQRTPPREHSFDPPTSVKCLVCCRVHLVFCNMNWHVSFPTF